MEIALDDIPVMYIKAEGGTAGARQAFHKLESGLPSLRGRRFYGTYQAGEYRACVALLPNDHPESLGFDTWVIPGGNYFREKMTDWNQRIPEIGKRFDAMAERILTDYSRPSIEFYRSQSEVHLLLPMV